jgi:mono/diheme cytochrome c family protein
VFAMLYLGPYRNPGWFSPSFAILAFLFGVAAVSTGEFIREAVRKPFVVYNVVLSNQILPAEIPRLRREGYLEGGRWTKAYVATHHPQTIRSGKIDGAELVKLPREDRVALGRVLFQHHCNDCHADTQGYSAAAELLRGWTPEMIRPLVKRPEQFQFFMPPWCGTDEEAELLTEYLASIAPPSPAGMAHSKDRASR